MNSPHGPCHPQIADTPHMRSNETDPQKLRPTLSTKRPTAAALEPEHSFGFPSQDACVPQQDARNMQ
jgi:hypothetical protein